MDGQEKFDLSTFAPNLRGLSEEDQQDRVQEEVKRVSKLVVREPSRIFRQQLYLQHLKRLSRFLTGKDVARELTPSEARAYRLLTDIASQPARIAAPVPAPSAPVLTAEERVDAKLGGRKEHRRSRRVGMATRVRIRRESGPEPEVLEPVNVSRGGISFESARQYDLHEIVWVKMHYAPNLPDGGGAETRSMIVRAVPLPRWEAFSYGIKFLTA